VSSKFICQAAWLGVLLFACEVDDRTHHTYDDPVPFAVAGDRLGVRDGDAYRPIFIKGVNLGVAVPGTQAGELAATREQYDRWFSQMAELGFNAIRTYTLHQPRFYQAFAKYNREHPDRPLWLLHGAWLDEENETGDFFDMTAEFDDGIREVIDCAHGECDVPERKGQAYGRYRTDVTPWMIGWIIGREIAPGEVTITNAAHAKHRSYHGQAISLDQGTPIEAWFAERLDVLVNYERARYGVERPVSVSSWPTLDPLAHPEEGNEDEDAESLDLANIDTSLAPAGYFASFHAYPYYPDFITRDPLYQAGVDSQGPNTYLAYLRHLKQHYAHHPLLIAEFGIPTSWGNAHFGAADMNHGGEDEEQQGIYAARLLTNTLEADCAGGAFFAWIDEWWKRTWIVDELAMPRENYRLWHNVTSPEQNFGLIQFELGRPRWQRLAQGGGRISAVEAAADAEFFHARVQLERPLRKGERLTIGYDTYGDPVGESVLPDGTPSQRRNEFALVITDTAPAQLYVTGAYDTFGIWHGLSTEAQLYRSIASDGGEWKKVRWRNNAQSEPEVELMSPVYRSVDEIGTLRVQHAGEQPNIKDGVVIDGATIEVRIPWTLLHFTDPTTRSVLDDDRATPGRETRVSEGIALSVALDADLIETGRFAWDGWQEAPRTTERLKRSAEIFAETLHALP
jgi:hypothetical protein